MSAKKLHALAERLLQPRTLTELTATRLYRIVVMARVQARPPLGIFFSGALVFSCELGHLLKAYEGEEDQG